MGITLVVMFSATTLEQEKLYGSVMYPVEGDILGIIANLT